MQVFITCISEENEERSMIEPNSREDPKVKELMKVTHWTFRQLFFSVNMSSIKKLKQSKKI